MCFAVLRSPPSPSFFKSAVYQRDSSPPLKVCLKNWVLHISLLLKSIIAFFTCFSERELRFTFAIWYRPSVCRLSVSVCLSICVRVCCSLMCSRCLLPCSFDERKLSSISDVRFTYRSPRHSTYVGLHNCFSYFHEAGFLNRMLFLILSGGRETAWSVITIRRRLLLRAFIVKPVVTSNGNYTPDFWGTNITVFGNWVYGGNFFIWSIHERSDHLTLLL